MFRENTGQEEWGYGPEPTPAEYQKGDVVKAEKGGHMFSWKIVGWYREKSAWRLTRLDETGHPDETFVATDELDEWNRPDKAA